MRVYLLERTEGDYDEAVGFVVVAHNDRDARNVVAEQAGSLTNGPMGEGAAAWLDAARSHVRSIDKADSTMQRGIVLRVERGRPMRTEHAAAIVTAAAEVAGSLDGTFGEPDDVVNKLRDVGDGWPNTEVSREALADLVDALRAAGVPGWWTT